MKLIYVNEIGSDYKGQKQYEFIFSNSSEIDMEDWYIIPASSTSNSLSPDVEYINIVGLLKDSNVELELVQNSDYFGVIDAVDNVVSLAWEKYNPDTDEDRLTFRFAESLENVTKKLKSRNYNLIKQEIKTTEHGA